MYICKQCGHSAKILSKFCTKCGAPMEDTSLSTFSSTVGTKTEISSSNTVSASFSNSDFNSQPANYRGRDYVKICMIFLLISLLEFGGLFLFTKVLFPPVKKMLTIEASYGGVVKTLSREYKVGSKVKLVAEAEDGYQFVRWVREDGEEIDDCDEASLAFEMPDDDVKVAAVFILDELADVTDADAAVYSAYNRLNIGYSNGDFAQSVTSKLDLPTTFDVDGITVLINWSSSNSGTIDNNGNVIRSYTDSNVKLSATLSCGNASSMTKDFDVVVIGKTSFDYSDPDDYSVMDLNKLNEGKSFDVTYNADRDYVTTIRGRFSEVKVNSVESALQAITNVRSIIGIRNPSYDLVWSTTNYDEENLYYSFERYWNGFRVYGLSLTVAANRATGETTYLKTSIKPDEILNRTDTSIYYSSDSIYSTYSDANIRSVETVVYALDEYSQNPIMAYLAIGDTDIIIVSAIDGTLISRYTYVCDANYYATQGSGVDELGNVQQFPVQYYGTEGWAYYLEDVTRGIYIKGDTSSSLAHQANTNWDDSTAVSAYINTIKVYDWYKSHLNRNSIDGNGMDIIVNVHATYSSDNACWNSYYHDMTYFDNINVNNGHNPTTAAGLDIAAHEMTHGVFQYIVTGPNNSLPYSNYTGAIMEGYSDVFGWLIDHDDNLMGEDWISNGLRDISDPSKNGTPSPKVLSDYSYYYFNDGTLDQSMMVHVNSSLVYYSAYLMEKYGLSLTKLEKAWYNSLYLGYDNNSDFFTVRENLIASGELLNYADADMCAIRKAFDTEEIYAERGSLNIVFTDVFGNPIDISSNNGLMITATGQKKCYPDNTYTSFDRNYNAAYFDDIYEGPYDVTVSLEGYLPFYGEVDITEGVEETIQIVLVRAGEAEPVQGYITSATTGYAVPYVNITVYEGWNVRSGNIVAMTSTDSNGYYSVKLDTGYYTLVLEKDDYTTGYMNVISAPEYNGLLQNGSISPIISEYSNYRVVLSWGEYPSDLDAHLVIKENSSTIDHVYYNDQNGYYNGEHIANLDVDDTTSYGPETITFNVKTGLEYQYFIDWYNGSGTWANCRGKVEVYSGDMLLYVFTAPSAYDQSGSWLVFTIKNGIFRVEDMQVSDMY